VDIFGKEDRTPTMSDAAPLGRFGAFTIPDALGPGILPNVV
jgi:hypothetical protein